MNSRIKELIEQSKCLRDGYNTGAVDLEKFAELIVRECGRFVDFRNQKYMPSTITVTGDDLEELFGLKD